MRLITFSYRRGVPEADLVFDARPLPNPHAEMKELTGLDYRVQDWLWRRSAFRRAYFELGRLIRSGSYESIAIGCLGGRHRSVALAELIRKDTKGITVEHTAL